MFSMISVIVITHALVFIAVSLYFTGDPFLALKNFYSLSYNVGF